MALAASLLAWINSSTNASSYASGAGSPAADRFLLAFVSATGSAIQPTVPTPSGWGLTWSQVGTSHNFFSGSNGAGLWVFGAKTSTAPGSGSFTANFGAQAMLGAEAAIIETSGHDLSATVAQLVVQFVKSTIDATGTTDSLALAAAGAAANRPFSYWVHFTDEVTNFQTNWTELHDLGHIGPTRGAESQWRSDAFETTASADWTTSSSFGAVALEVKAAGADAPRARGGVLVGQAIQRSAVW